jgi:DNA-binding CsgD family transcriptional regulator
MPIFAAGKGHKLRVVRNRAGEDVRLTERRNQALELRRDGLNYRQIGVVMGCDPSTAYNYVQHELRIIRDQTAEDTEAQRDLELQRCDQMQAALGPAMRAGDIIAIATMLKVSERRSRLLGLDAPERKEVLHAIVTPEEVAKMSDRDLFEMSHKLLQFTAAALPPDDPALKMLEGEVVDTAFTTDPDTTDAALEAEDARVPPKVSIDVSGYMSAPRQGPFSRTVSPLDFCEDGGDAA